MVSFGDENASACTLAFYI